MQRMMVMSKAPMARVRPAIATSDENKVDESPKMSALWNKNTKYF